jgi:hypothetical protein
MCETSPYKSGVHANYEELKTLDDKTKKKMALIHYQDNIMEDEETGLGIKTEWEEKVEKDGFGYGFIAQGSELEI